MEYDPQLRTAVEVAATEHLGDGVVCGDVLVLCEVMDGNGSVGFVNLTDVSSRHAEMMLVILSQMVATGTFRVMDEGIGTDDEQ